MQKSSIIYVVAVCMLQSTVSARRVTEFDTVGVEIPRLIDADKITELDKYYKILVDSINLYMKYKGIDQDQVLNQEHKNQIRAMVKSHFANRKLSQSLEPIQTLHTGIATSLKSNSIDDAASKLTHLWSRINDSTITDSIKKPVLDKIIAIRSYI